MNSLLLAIPVIAGGLFVSARYLPSTPASYDNHYVVVDENSSTEDVAVIPEKSAWEQNAIEWLVKAQSPNGGWGAGSHAYQNVRDPQMVQTDPATTAFASMALLKAGGPLKDNPYKAQIMKALDRLLADIQSRNNNGRITSLEGTQPQVKLGIHIDASMALQFLSEISDQLTDEKLQKSTDDAAQVCVDLIQKSQDTNGGWAGGGWAPVLQSAMANNALEIAQAKYDVDEKAIENSRKYQAENMSSGEVRSADAAGVALYAVASTQRATAVEARETTDNFDPGMYEDYSSGKIKKEDITRTLVSKGMSKDKAERLSSSFEANYTSTKALQDEAIWDGFGNNGGEEYLSYLLTSESLAQQSKEDWLKWRQSIEPKFKQSQNPNGSWSGHHCITSPVFCTAAIVQAMNAN